MRQLCIIGSERSSAGVLAGTEGSLELEGLPFRYGVIETDDLSFDADAGENAEKVFLRVRAFSCNYRDRALILSMSNSAHKSNYYVIGSEFVAEVLAVGRDVTALAPGDRVIANGAYPDSGVDGVDPGLPRQSRIARAADPASLQAGQDSGLHARRGGCRLHHRRPDRLQHDSPAEPQRRR